MATQFQPTRLEVNDRFPMLGFTIRTDGTAKRFEIAIGTPPDLFGPDGKTQRTRNNFYSSRATGPMPTAGSPYIKVSWLTGRSLQRVRPASEQTEAGPGYGANGSEMEWSGDAATPGTKPANAASPKVTETSPRLRPMRPLIMTTGTARCRRLCQAAPEPAKTQAKSLADDYAAQAGDDNQHDIGGPIPDGPSFGQGLAKSLALTPE